jgi:hypothetical protein
MQELEQLKGISSYFSMRIYCHADFIARVLEEFEQKKQDVATCLSRHSMETLWME